MNRAFFPLLMLCLLNSMVLAEPYRAAILDEPSMPVEGKATPVATFEKACGDEGIPLTRLNADRLADEKTFNADAFDLLIVPTGASFPVAAKTSLLAFLQKGGDLFCTGGYAFDNLLLKKGDAWVSCKGQYAEEKAKARDPKLWLIPNGGFENGGDGWLPSNSARCSVVQQEPVSGLSCAQITAADATGASWETPLAVEPGKSYLIGAHAKTKDVCGTGYAFLAVYQYDAQGNWIRFVDFAVLRGADEWKRYETEVEVLPHATRVVFRAGLFMVAGMVWLDDVTCAPLPKEERINAHYGKPDDGLLVEPTQLMIFSPDQRIEGKSLLYSIDWTDRTDRTDLAIEGYEATAQLGQVARWVPLIEACDQSHRPSGAVGALVHHFAGPFTDSSWALFGVTNRDIFEEDAARSVLKTALKRLRTGVYFKSVESDSAMLRRGETAHWKAEVCNASREPCAVGVFSMYGFGTSLGTATGSADIRLLELAPQSTGAVDFSSPILDDFANDFQIHCRLNCKDGVLDIADSASCVEDHQTISKGPHITTDGNYFALNSVRKACLFGTDTYANMFLSPSQSPLTWSRDMQLMRDYGLHMFENLQYTPKDYVYSEKEWRQLDAMIQLAQQNGLPYMFGLLVGRDIAVDDVELAKQAEMCRSIAARYKDVPGIIYYLNGDFQLHLKDTPDLRRLWNDSLRARYGTDDKLRATWIKNPPEAALGELPLKDWTAQSWFDVRARDLSAFRAELMKRWIGALCKAIRQEDPTHPITSEYYQRPYDGVDLRLSCTEMDAANFGYFDFPKLDTARLMACIKWNDMSYYGKGVNIGEFGVKTHDAWAPERGGTNYHVQRTPEEQLQLTWWMAHAALAMGVGKIQNWCWSDDPDRIFPWGLAYNNPLRPKPVLKLYRNLSLLADRIQPSERTAQALLVMPDNWRLGAPVQLGNDSLTNAIECLLATNVPFDVINEADVASLKPPVPRLVMIPLAYALSDTTLNALSAIAEQGSCLYLSGDPSFDENGQRQLARFERVLGVHFERDGEPVSGLPMPVVTATTATLETSRYYRVPRGQGVIIWSPEPWEVFARHDLFVKEPELTEDASSNFYLTLISLAKVEPPLRIKANCGVWRAMVSPSGNNRLVTVFPRGLTDRATTVDVSVAGADMRFEVALPVPALVLLNPQGQPLMATGSRSLSIGNEMVVKGDGNWTIASQNDQPLTDTTSLYISSTVGGTFWWRSRVENLQASLVERQNGNEHELAQAPLHRQDDGWAIEVLPNELYSISQSSHAPANIDGKN